MSTLPIEPFDGMIFIDTFNIKWVFNAQEDCWKHDGKVDQIPLASPSITGLLAQELKQLIDTIPPKGGGYAILTKPLNNFRSQSNPDGVLFGDIELFSNTLDIKCVDAQDNDISNNPTCANLCFKETDAHPPGFDINLSSKFLDTLCVEIPGGPGPVGIQGEVGPPGLDGTGDGPQGETGDSGQDATEHFKLTGVKFIDLIDTFDTAVVKLDLQQTNGNLQVTKGRVALPVDNTTPVEQLLVRKLIRGVKFNAKCLDFSTVDIVCLPTQNINGVPVDEPTNPDPIIAFYPVHFDPTNAAAMTTLGQFQPIKAKFSELVKQITDFYNQKLVDASDQWDKQISDFLTAKDKEARAILDQHTSDLATAEAMLGLDMCVGINQSPTCNPSANNTFDPNNPITQGVYGVLLELLGCPNTSIMTDLGKRQVFADTNPVFAFTAPAPLNIPGVMANGIIEATTCSDPNGCWVLYPEGALTFVPHGETIPAGSVVYSGPIGCGVIPPQLQSTIIPDATDPAQINLLPTLSPSDAADLLAGHPKPHVLAEVFDKWAQSLATALHSGIVLYKKDRLRYSPSIVEFPSGTYVFIYNNGAFTQQTLNANERYGRSAQDAILVNGGFQHYFVGNEGGVGRSPFQILNPFRLSKSIEFDSALASDEVGLEIGFAPIGYQDLIPLNYFSNHKFDAAQIEGHRQFNHPLKFVDYNGLPHSTEVMEKMITWYTFPTIGNGTADAQSLQTNYLNGPITGRSLIIRINEPGFFFTRVKLAHHATNFFGSLVMPMTPNDDTTYSTNRAMIYEKARFSPPTINALAEGIGNVELQVIRVEGCGENEVGSAPHTSSGSGAGGGSGGSSGSGGESSIRLFTQSKFTTQLTTTNGNLTTAGVIPINDNTEVLVTVHVLGHETNAAGHGVIDFQGAAYRQNGGPVTLNGTINYTLSRLTNPSWMATLTPSGDNLLVQVQGVPGANIDWSVQYSAETIR